VPGVVDDALALQTVQAAVGRPDPEAPFAIFVEREDPVGGEAACGRIAGEPAVTKPVEAVSGTDPDRAFPVAPEHAGEGRRQTLRGGVEPVLVSDDVDESATRPDPESSPAVADDRERRAGKALLDRAHFDAPGRETRQAVRQAEPEIPRRVLVQRAGALGRKSVLRREDLELAVADPGETGARADPEGAVARLDQGPDERALESRAFAEGFEPPIATAREPRQRADPETPVAGLAERLDPVVFQRRRVAGIENGESNAVESNQSFLRAEPEVAVTGLQNLLDGVLRQSRVAVPGVVAVVSLAPGGIERICPPGEERGERRHSEPEPPPSRPSDRSTVRHTASPSGKGTPSHLIEQTASPATFSSQRDEWLDL
jgi:hypothetical protein